MTLHLISLGANLILSSKLRLGHRSAHFVSGFPIKIYEFLFFPRIIVK
jgi:hypothetical protein